MNTVIWSENQIIPVLYDEATPTGIQKIWKKVEKDIFDTTKVGCRQISKEESAEFAVIIVMYGCGDLAKQLTARIPELNQLQGRIESYAFYLVEEPLEQIKQGLVIMGSDLLGTIYGMFHLSELLGVHSCGFWGDVTPPSYEKVIWNSAEYAAEITENSVLHISVRNHISKEPSVRYRGFFINDEWPCFGNWTTEHFGGFTAEMYDHIFEYLLRMKGNYLWPAMWTSCFLMDGPGLASMELATEYGIYIGMSHHEPCMRSGEEFSRLKGEDSPYGTEWSYAQNKEGLLRFWEDGLKRVKGHTIFPTIGMRGERDSKLLGEDATIDDNVSQLKEVIRMQRKILADCINPDLKQVPQLFAIYKEVEDYYYGDGKTSGIRGFEELEDVTLLFCEDNHGNMRYLPQEEERSHPGGFGMYYHFDYHGGPISYEWVNSTPISKVWEQMTQAYEYGVRKLWIVNVGDVKFNEYPLNYFMDLAYDFEKWGTSAPNQTHAYTEEWIEKQFGAYTSKEQRKEIVEVLEESVRLNGLRRPEACNDRIYDPVHYGEGRRMLARCRALEQKNEKLKKELEGTACADGYFSMIYFPAAASANLLAMHLYSGLNHLYASQGKAAANQYGELSANCILRDQELAEQMADFRGGKWRGMELAAHIGFTNWNEEDWRYPVRHVLTLPQKPRLVVSRMDEKRSYTNQYSPVPLEINDFLNPGTEEVCIEIANGGSGAVEWRIDERIPELELSCYEGKTELTDVIRIRVKQNLLEPERSAKFEFNIRTERERIPILVRAAGEKKYDVPAGTILESDGLLVFDAADYAESKAAQGAAFEKLEDFGKYESGMKVFPVTKKFKYTEKQNETRTGDDRAIADVPSLTYCLYSEQGGDYTLELHISPANPLAFGSRLWLGVSVNDENVQNVAFTDESYRGGECGCGAWANAVLDQEHIAELAVALDEGLNRLTVYAGSPGIVLERLVLRRAGTAKKESYLGPQKIL